MKNLQSMHRYLGTSSETKPSPSVVPAGSEFFELDTKERYINNSASWENFNDSDYPYAVEIAQGERLNHTAFQKLAFNPAIVASSEVVWGVGAVYTFPSAAMGMEIVSDNAGDASAGAGARTVHIHYLNSSYEEKAETITMNGATVVPTASTDFFRINNFEVLTAGSTGTAIGNIDIRATSDTPIYGRIVAGTTLARDGVFTVPQNTELFLNHNTFSAAHTAANKYTLMTIRSNYNRRDSISSSVFYPEVTTMLDAGAVPVHLDIPMIFHGKSDIKLTASSNGTAAVAMAIRGWLEPS